MKYFVVFSAFILASYVRAIPLPQGRITEAEFRSLRDEDVTPEKVNIVSGYAQVRRQGRNFGTGEIFSYKRPLTVRNPLEFAGSARGFDSVSVGKVNRVEAAPVFNLDDMLKKQAAKVKAQVKESSLAAARAAEEAEEKIEEMVAKAMDETKATREDVEAIIEEAVETGIEEAEKIIEDELMEAKGASDVEDEIFGEGKNGKAESINAIKNSDEPSKDIDLGSVQEV